MRLLLFAAALLGLTCGGRQPADVPAEAAAPGAAVADSIAEGAAAIGPAADPDSTTRAVFGRIMGRARAEAWHARPYGELVQAVGLALVGTPYRDGLLDQGEEETLVASLAAFDCVLFVENVLALAQGIAREDYGFDGYLARLEGVRYRGGTRDGYCSRLHYFTDWIHDNDARAHVDDVTAAVGGEPFEKRIDFMSTHRESYRRLVDDATFACIVDMEADLRARRLAYIPKARVAAAYDRLEPGDLIATTTSIGGLDVTHTGFVVRLPNGGTGFLHASSTGAVKVSDDLAAYLAGNRAQTGILVARPLAP